MYHAHQPWDPLKVCIVGRSYAPEFYSFIKNTRVRSVMERIAQETEEDYQKLIALLTRFGVTVLRPQLQNDMEFYLQQGKIMAPPMSPRDYTAMVGERFYIDRSTTEVKWEIDPGQHWPVVPATQYPGVFEHTWSHILDHIQAQGNVIEYDQGVNTATLTRAGKNLFLGTNVIKSHWELERIHREFSTRFSQYRCKVINTGGHADGTFCPVVPGLIVSLCDIPTYHDTFPDWEVVYLPGQSWDMIDPFLKLKHKNKGKWWVPGEELNDEFTDFVESWLDRWVGYVEETVFDVNMLVIDEKNVVCNNYNKTVFDAFDRYGIQAHLVNFRHRYFWDGGLHCITSDLHRIGAQKDYFPI